MEIDTTETGELRFRKVYNPIVLDTENGQTFGICMREDGIEVTMVDTSIKHDGPEVYTRTFYLVDGMVKCLAERETAATGIGFEGGTPGFVEVFE